MFFYSSAISANTHHFSLRRTYEDTVLETQYETQYENFETGSTYAEESAGFSRSGAPLSDTSFLSGRSAWVSSSTESTQQAFSTTQEYVTDPIAGTSFGDASPVTGTYVKTADGVVEANSHRYTLTTTETVQFVQTFATVGEGDFVTTISGAASATQAGTQTYTTTASQNAPVYLYGGVALDQRYNAERGLLPPARQVGMAFAVTEGSLANSAYSVATFTEDLNRITGFYSRVTYSTTAQTVDQNVNFSSTEQRTGSYEYFNFTNWSTTGLAAVVSAERKIYNQPGYINTNGLNNVYSTFSANPSGLTDLDLFVSVFHNINSVYVFTQTVGGLTLDGSSGSAAWVYTNGEWSLRLTKANGSTSTTLYGTLSLMGSAFTTDEIATAAIGNTTAVLGPRIPATQNQMDHVSISLQESADTSRPFFLFSAQVNTSWTEASFSLSESSSLILSLGSSYPASSLRAYKKHIGISFSTETTTMHGTGFSFTLPGVWQHSKWNEAGRNDAVSVNQ